jgi:protease PrsW
LTTPPRIVEDRAIGTDPAQAAPPAPRRFWLWLLVAGAVVWAVATAITAVTEDTILVPNVILLGSFLVPICTVAFALGRADAANLSPGVLLLGFVVGGTLAMPPTALTETLLLPSRYGTFAAVGLIEETGKGLVLLVLASRVETRGVRAGMILGATVGAGFASFESAGYALSAVIGHSDDHPVIRIVGTELSRAALAPFGHITWTAPLGGALLAGERLLDRRVLWTFLGIVALHGAWDASYGWAVILTRGFLGDGWSVGWPNTEGWVGQPAGNTLLVFNVTYTVLQLINSVIGVAWVVHRWRTHGRARPV